MPDSVVSQQEVAGASPASVGAKAVTLGRLASHGIPVPAFFAVASGAFARHLAENGIPWPPEEGAEDPARVRERIREAPVPDAVARPVLEAYAHLCAANGHDRVAVRSSGGEEDSATASFAGQFASILGVGGPSAVVDALRACWASSLSDRSLRYRAGEGAPLRRAPSFGVIVQRQVFSEKAGVLFTVHPLEPGSGMSYIEANFGTGESVTGGLTNPDSIAVSRANAHLVEARVGTKRRMTSVGPDTEGSRVIDIEGERQRTPVLSEGEVETLARLGLRIEALLGGPQDVEWAFDDRGLWILQARPVTALNRTVP